MDILVIKNVVLVGAIIGGLICVTKLTNYVNNFKQANRAENYLSQSLPTFLKWNTQSLDSFFLPDMVGKDLQTLIAQTKNNMGECIMTTTPDCHIKTNKISCPFAQDRKQTIECDVTVICKKAQMNRLTFELMKKDFKCIGLSIVPY